MTAYTTDELIEGSKHLHYEITMMGRDLQLMKSIHASEKSPLKQYLNPFFKSFCVHARCIYEFLYGSRKYEDDIKPSDYAENEKWTKPDLPEELKMWKAEIDKRVVHLTSRRMNVEEVLERWEVGYIYSELQKALLEFYRWVPNSKICFELVEEKERALEEAKSRQRGQIPKDLPGFSTGTIADR